jgi:hypothetical protein
MPGRISIEAHEAGSFGVPIGALHLYLVYEDLGNGEEYVIRSGPENPWQLVGGDMEIATNVPIEDSPDDRGGDTPADRFSTVLDFSGRSADDAWSIMVKYCRALAAADYEYNVLEENSNAFVGAMIHAAGGVPSAMLPDGVGAGEVIGYSYWDDIVGDVAPPADGVFHGTGRADVMAGLQMDEVFDLLGGSDTLRAGRGNDSGLGGAGNDTLFGQDGADTLRGAEGSDRLLGDRGRDYLGGGSGADVLAGRAGNDRLSGGVGADFFDFATGGGTDVIADFLDGTDRIRIDAAGIERFADLEVRATGPGGGDVRIGYDGGAIVMRDLDLADFDASDVRIVLHDILTV